MDPHLAALNSPVPNNDLIFTVGPFDGLGSSFELESIDFPFYVSLLASTVVRVILATYF